YILLGLEIECIRTVADHFAIEKSGALGLAGGAFEKLKFAINPTQVPSLSTSQRVEWLENRILELENILTDVLNPSALQIMRYVLSRSESNFGNDR
ncbi:8357_t:CDS:2, partial [Rhizophagus irregularis]